MSNVLIVHAHPEPKSLTSALKDIAGEAECAWPHGEGFGSVCHGMESRCR